MALQTAMVVAVIGLLVGAILAGQHLLAASALRSSALQMKDYITAVAQFRDKFGELPGDFSRATTYFGTDSNGCPTTQTTAGLMATCNGNGDGQITGAERYRAWQQLAAGGFVSGLYSGNGGASNTQIPGFNVPRVGNLGAVALIEYGVSGLYNASDLVPQNTLYVGAVTAGSIPTTAALTAADARYIDDKIDDGYPGMGSVRTYGSNANCVDTVATPPNYKFTQTSGTSTAPACALGILVGM